MDQKRNPSGRVRGVAERKGAYTLNGERAKQFSGAAAGGNDMLSSILLNPPQLRAQTEESSLDVAASLGEATRADRGVLRQRVLEDGGRWRGSKLGVIALEMLRIRRQLPRKRHSDVRRAARARALRPGASERLPAVQHILQILPPPPCSQCLTWNNARSSQAHETTRRKPEHQRVFSTPRRSSTPPRYDHQKSRPARKRRPRSPSRPHHVVSACPHPHLGKS